MNINSDVIDAVTFDFYNTLVHHRQGRGRGAMVTEYLDAQGWDRDPWEHQVLYDIFENHETDYTPDKSAEEKYHYYETLADRLFQRLNVRAPNGAASEHAANLWYLLGPASLALFPEVTGVLRVLKEGDYPLAVVSNWQCGLHNFCIELGIGPVFDHVLASAEIDSEKPDATIFHEACRRLNTPAHRVLHVGDTILDDVEGARAAGMPAVLLQRNDEAPPPDTLAVSSLEKLPELLGLNNLPLPLPQVDRCRTHSDTDP